MTKTTIIAMCVSASLLATPTLAHADPVGSSPGTISVTPSDYSLDESRGLLPKGGDRLLVYGEQDSMPAPAPKKKNHTALYVVGGIALLIGVLFVIANNTKTVPDGFLEF